MTSGALKFSSWYTIVYTIRVFARDLPMCFYSLNTTCDVSSSRSDNNQPRACIVRSRSRHLLLMHLSQSHSASRALLLQNRRQNLAQLISKWISKLGDVRTCLRIPACRYLHPRPHFREQSPQRGRCSDKRAAR